MRGPLEFYTPAKPAARFSTFVRVPFCNPLVRPLCPRYPPASPLTRLRALAVCRAFAFSPARLRSWAPLPRIRRIPRAFLLYFLYLICLLYFLIPSFTSSHPIRLILIFDSFLGPPIDMNSFDVICIGAGPTGLACAIEVKRAGMRPVVIDKGCLCNSLYHYPMNMQFFTTAERMEIGDLPLTTAGAKPSRAEALKYYRRAAEHYGLETRLCERVAKIDGHD